MWQVCTHEDPASRSKTNKGLIDIVDQISVERAPAMWLGNPLW